MNKLSRFAMIGMIITATCNFTQVLVPLASMLGLEDSVGALHAVMMGLLALFIFIFLAGMFRSKSKQQTDRDHQDNIRSDH